jgi:hypothetical protein
MSAEHELKPQVSQNNSAPLKGRFSIGLPLVKSFVAISLKDALQSFSPSLSRAASISENRNCLLEFGRRNTKN